MASSASCLNWAGDFLILLTGASLVLSVRRQCQSQCHQVPDARFGARAISSWPSLFYVAIPASKDTISNNVHIISNLYF